MGVPPDLPPDTKDWTWVLGRACTGCGFDARALDVTKLGELTRANAAAWPPLLTDPAVRERPTEQWWSALEYGCHVRDVFRLFDERLRLMLGTDDPHFANWDQDETAVASRYHEQDPDAVADELVAAGAAIADRWDGVAGDQWSRTGNRSDGARFTVESFGRYFLHDPVHHLDDVARGYRVIRAR